MKEKRDCKIVQDLLPNYIEKLTDDETNLFIEEHLIECSKCKKILENMKKDMEVNNTEKNKQEIKYIKKFNKKLKFLKNIIIIIVLLFIIIVGRKAFILSNLSNKAQEIQNSQNYYLKLESYASGTMTITEAYYKQEKALVEINIYSKEKGEVKQTMYKSGDEKISLIENGDNKVLIAMGDISVRPIAFTSESFLVNLYTAITTNVEKIILDGKQCYMIRDGNTEKFIDINTGLAIKIIDNQNNRTVDYEYKYGIVKDSDIIKPDITGYTITE